MKDHSTLGHDMAELARSLALPDSLDDRLAAVTAAAVRMIGGVGCASILLVAKHDYESVAATDQLSIDLDAVQQKFGEGPCRDAAKAEPIVRCDDLRADPRWPRFAQAAVESGVFSMLSLKLYTGDDTIGALNLFGFDPAAFDADDEDIGSILATHAAIALMGARKDQQFKSALATRDVIGQAKGIVMERYGLDAERAFELLARQSQNTNVPLAKLAARMVLPRASGPRVVPGASAAFHAAPPNGAVRRGVKPSNQRAIEPPPAPNTEPTTFGD